jgi:hypothetical protein
LLGAGPARAQSAPDDTVQLAGPVSVGLPLAARTLDKHFPRVKEIEWNQLRSHSRASEEMLMRILARAPAALLVFAAVDVHGSVDPDDAVPPADVRKDQPMFVVFELRDGMMQVLTLEGEMQVVLASQLAVAPSGPQPFPAFRKADLGYQDARARSAPEDQALSDRFDADSARFEACADRIWKKEVGDLPYEYDLLIIKGHHATSVRELANRKIEKLCNGKRMAKITAAYVAALNAARSARRMVLVKALEQGHRAL